MHFARLAGDRPLRGPVAFCRRRDARRTTIAEARPARHSRGSRNRSAWAATWKSRCSPARACTSRTCPPRRRSNTCASQRKSKLRVTCEVTPHHFTLTDEDVRYDSHYKMNPPLASRADRDALIAGLADGSVDAIATDHAPHHAASKDVEFDRAPFGITRLRDGARARLKRARAFPENFR